MKKTNIPDGFEDTGQRKNGHIIIRCTKRVMIDGSEVQCIYTTRNCKNPAFHACRGVVTTPIEERRVDIMKDIAKFIGKANLSLNSVEQDYFSNFMKSLIEIGQGNPSVKCKIFGKKLLK